MVSINRRGVHISGTIADSYLRVDIVLMQETERHF